MALFIIATVAIYGLTAAPLARRLGLAVADPQGILIAGAHSVAREIAMALRESGVRVLLVDSNRGNVRAANMAPGFYQRDLAECARRRRAVFRHSALPHPSSTSPAP